MVYSFARIGAVIQMKVGDYFVQGRRRWVRLHEKGGKEYDVPCHHSLDQCLHDYIEAAGIIDDIDGYLFRTARRKTGQLTTNPLFQQDARRIIRLDELSGLQFDFIITVDDNARESCPILFGDGQKRHGDFKDPAAFAGSEEQRLDLFRRVRDDLRSYLREFALNETSAEPGIDE
jgi:hypothetical protein